MAFITATASSKYLVAHATPAIAVSIGTASSRPTAEVPSMTGAEY